MNDGVIFDVVNKRVKTKIGSGNFTFESTFNKHCIVEDGSIVTMVEDSKG